MLVVIPFILAAGSLSTLVSGAPVPSTFSARNAFASLRSLVERNSDTYTTYGGDGLVSQGWPAQSDWVSSFDTMLFNNNKGIMTSSCSEWNVADNSDSEITDIYNGIKTVSAESGVDARFILAIILQESNGCVRVPTTNWGVRNPGLMQDHNGAATCNENGVQNPCPADTITQMIRDGTEGTSSGDGLKQCLAESKATDVSMYYKAARIFNSGSIDSSGNLGAGVATHCYASDVANRLTGWVYATHTCSESSIGSMTGTVTATTGGGDTTNPGDNTHTPTVTPTTVVPTVTPTIVVPTQVGDSTPSSTKAPGASASCKGWYTVQSGDYCGIVEQKFGVTMAQLQSWNTQLLSDCSNLWLGYSYCVSA
ncbi:carbohydrate-binding module family 50 protein [Lepidopterella palustris CBS 459.81]|uniref:Carbohydrate-binding module family 50 protein n=1 Tax=Lepidopterella palustris CBS 459.81 TaxID=1314670 RepID=A0A8E2JDI2_9PEZI|nr:carbohydrate-binding module family 50 protein [Lepidopterella palustris CBS 459.81]